MAALIYDFKDNARGRILVYYRRHFSVTFNNIFEQFARCHAKQFSMRHVTNFNLDFYLLRLFIARFEPTSFASLKYPFRKKR